MVLPLESRQTEKNRKNKQTKIETFNLKQAFYFICFAIPIHVVDTWSSRKSGHHHNLKYISNVKIIQQIFLLSIAQLRKLFTSPTMGTINPAPIETNMSVISRVKPVGAPLIAGSPVNEFDVFAIHIGRLLQPNLLQLSIFFCTYNER